MRLRPAESIIYITLLHLARERARTLGEPAGVTVKELSKRLKMSESAVRAILNSLKEKELIEAKSSVYVSLYGLKKKGREKIWLPKHGLNDEEIKRILKEHSEIVEHVGSEKVKELLGIDFEDEAHLKVPVRGAVGAEFRKERLSATPAIVRGLRGKIEQHQTLETDEMLVYEIIEEALEEWKEKDEIIKELLDGKPELEGALRVFAKDVIERYKAIYHNT